MSHLWKDYEQQKKKTEPYLGYGYVKMCRKIKKTHVAYMDKLGKIIKMYCF
jgi:hypothetical protein